MKPHPPIPAGWRLQEPDEIHPNNNLNEAGIPCNVVCGDQWGSSGNFFGKCADFQYIVPQHIPRIIPPLNASTVEAWRAACKANAAPVATRSRDSLTKTATLRRRASSAAYGRAKGVR